MGGFEFGKLLSGYEFVENKTYSKIKDIEHETYKEKLEFIIVDFIILGQGTRSMLKSICYTFIHRATSRIRAERKLKHDHYAGCLV